MVVRSRSRADSEHLELGPVQGVSDGALHLGMPGGDEGPDQLADPGRRDDVDDVEVATEG
jgi:hypothetical protein